MSEREKVQLPSGDTVQVSLAKSYAEAMRVHRYSYLYDLLKLGLLETESALLPRVNISVTEKGKAMLACLAVQEDLTRQVEFVGFEDLEGGLQEFKQNENQMEWLRGLFKDSAYSEQLTPHGLPAEERVSEGSEADLDDIEQSVSGLHVLASRYTEKVEQVSEVVDDVCESVEASLRRLRAQRATS